MIYLASPYSSPYPQIEHSRFLETRRFAWHYLRQGVPLVSPIVYCHQFAREFAAPTDAQGWLSLNLALLQAAQELWVLQLPGWETSVGVTQELKFASDTLLPVFYKEPLAHA